VICASRVLSALTIVAIALPCHAAPTTAYEAGMWLEGKSLQLIRSARTTMNDGTAAFLPNAGTGGYNWAFWLRDYSYMLEGSPEAFTKQELRQACLTFVGALRSDGAGVDCVRLDGTPNYMPGGNRGENPITDGGPFTVDMAWRTHQILNDTSLLQQIIDPLVKTMQAVPRDPANGLVHIDPTKTYDRVPYGFTDTVKKTGDELFTSLLDVRASRQLADLLDASGRTADASTWRTAAEAKAVAIRNTFWDSTTGLFNAATVQCKQPDIWGSAFAVQLGVATSDQSLSVARYLKAHYSDIVQDGQIRHLPGGTYWQSLLPGYETQGAFQNGGFWGVATGWVVSTLKLVDPQLADQTVIDLVNSYQQRGVMEWINGSQSNIANYVTSASLPLATLRSVYKLPDGPILKETGGALGEHNLASAANGAKAFAKDVISGYVEHAIDHLNDGVYGNANSWVAGSDETFVGITFAQPTRFDSLAFGRDNTGVLTDRFSGLYTFQYTTIANPGASSADSDWISFGVVYIDSLYPDTTGYLRHRFEFPQITGATGVRIRIEGVGVGIDELEVYSVPEPSAHCLAATAICSLAGMVSWTRYRSRAAKVAFRSAKVALLSRSERRQSGSFPR
jgi:hypothetical protein